MKAASGKYIITQLNSQTEHSHNAINFEFNIHTEFKLKNQ